MQILLSKFIRFINWKAPYNSKENAKKYFFCICLVIHKFNEAHYAIKVGQIPLILESCIFCHLPYACLPFIRFIYMESIPSFYMILDIQSLIFLVQFFLMNKYINMKLFIK